MIFTLYIPLTLSREAALFTLLRTAAEAELEIEDARYKLCASAAPQRYVR
jgi:hypothetical protein